MDNGYSAIKESEAFHYATPTDKIVEHALGTPANAPEEWPQEALEGQIWVPPPTLIVQSSIEGHNHCYWKLDKFIDDIEVLEDRNRAIAYVMHADTSGWDADQILRPIRTTNHKRNMPVIVKEWEREDEL